MAEEMKLTRAGVERLRKALARYDAIDRLLADNTAADVLESFIGAIVTRADNAAPEDGKVYYAQAYKHLIKAEKALRLING